MFTEIVSRVFYVKGEVKTADVTNKMIKDSLTKAQYDKLESDDAYTRFDWSFKSQEDANANNVKLRVPSMEGYLTEDLTDDEKWELRNVQARRSGSTKISNVANSQASVLKWAMQNYKHIDKATAEKVKATLLQANQAIEVMDNIIAGNAKGSNGSTKIKIEL